MPSTLVRARVWAGVRVRVRVSCTDSMPSTRCTSMVPLLARVRVRVGVGVGVGVRVRVGVGVGVVVRGVG